MSKSKSTQTRSPVKDGKKKVAPSQKNNSKKPFPNGPSKMAHAPVSQGRVTRSTKPQMRSQPNGDCRIRHREFISEILAGSGSPSAFKADQFVMNPGLPAAFPWLSQIAPRFEKYRFENLKFCFETEAPTSLGGSLVLTADYDASDPAPTSKVQAMAYRNAVRSPPWSECCHHSAKEDIHNQKGYFVRTGALQANQDIKLYDTGNLFVCSQNVATSGALLGELYVEYDVLLMTPQITSETNLASTATGSAGTSAAVISAGQLITGNLIRSVIGNVVNFQNLTPNSKYFLSYGSGTPTNTTMSFSTPVGLTVNSAFLGSSTSVANLLTFICTSITGEGSITVNTNGNAVSVIIAVSQLSASVQF